MICEKVFKFNGRGLTFAVFRCPAAAAAVIANLLLSLSVFANNIGVSNITTRGHNTAQKTTRVQFDLAWENSWRNPTNWDAAWVFVKFRNPATTGEWAHAAIGNLSNDHVAPAGSTIETVPDQTGVLIYRNADDSGTVSFPGIQLHWKYGENGVADDAAVDIQVFAIEMVLVPDGSFYIGDGNGSSEADKAFHSGSSNSAVQITNSLVGDIRVDSNIHDDNQLENIGIGVDGDDGLDADDDGVIDNPAFPTGYTAFYCMKYECSQGQYTAFLNTLTATQAAARFPDKNGTNGHTIDGSHLNFLATSPDRACNFLSWADAVAYADWAGLRPMTELEYEKACRGPIAPLRGEFAWGTTTIHQSPYTIADDGTPSEAISNPGNGNTGNVWWFFSLPSINVVEHVPRRCGIFAASALFPERDDTGGSFYGIMEMAGNVWERAVTVGSPIGRAFTGLHGDGGLSASGAADVLNWPADNAGVRGGTFLGGIRELMVSSRLSASAGFSSGTAGVGFRCVRTRNSP